ncbi:hypothetical protein [Helicobacter heilmannii]|uniref:hypothetical protein n=1 Tax=Helicobacter heilmannii TaxID=35817 RepID=UPI0006A06CBF|nr:hypothetical protein [Helicobacter heilmannii]CRF46453.1 hypothetical protein HHE014_14610 [Helicobacter heilmannii]CRF47077.1 hypothetical protein HHE02_03620 [Helicobacter heilmannii]CRF48597.1 hypothetical protein HHE03_01630 [Helicobacter heilmannii]CRF50600.1 hypothetical protein HHE06_04400 [Helicobacter heilmannii]GMB95052.1 hypothetical protein NHP21011_11490 [Helicobacter heilmannii]
MIIGTPAYGIEFNPKKGEVAVIECSFLGVLMQVHKGRAGVVLKVFRVFFGCFVFLLS